uniref:RNA helicase n=1 Tax=Eptatretus burgeri TaxID=7764 RepID=A0A8C4Q5K0_EPTBU
MIRNGFLKPNDFLAQCWTAVLAGIDLLAVSANCSNDTSSFLPPLLTWLVNPAAYAALPGGNGPLAAVVCAGWATASRVHSQLLLLLESLSGVRVLLLSLATGRNPEQLALLFEGVEVVVCSVDVLEDLSRCGHVPLSRLCHLVFFEACNLLARLPQQMEMVVSSFERVVSLREARGVHAPHQCILLAQQWTPALADLTKRLCVHEPYMVFADWLQAALYGGVSLDVHICHEEKRSEELRQFITSQDQQVQINGLIFANDNLQARQLHEELCSFDLPCLLALEPEEQQQAQLQWASEHNSSMIMIVTDDSSLRLDVSNATMVIHYTFPDSFNVLSQRLACLRDNFDSMIPRNDRIGKAKPSSLLLLSEECMAKAVGLLSHLVLAGITLPNSLQQLISAGSATHSEDRKHRPLCTNA